MYRIKVGFLASTWQLTTVSNSSSTGPDTLFWVPTVTRHTQKHADETQNKLIKLKKKEEEKR